MSSVLIVSVSARMLAELATKAGHSVHAYDAFGDSDLRRVCPTVSLRRELGGRGGMRALVEAATNDRAEAVVYGSGLENRPDLVARLAAHRELLGCSPATLRAVRDPRRLAESLRAAGLPFPRTLYRSADGLSPSERREEGSWPATVPLVGCASRCAAGAGEACANGTAARSPLARSCRSAGGARRVRRLPSATGGVHTWSRSPSNWSESHV